MSDKTGFMILFIPCDDHGVDIVFTCASQLPENHPDLTEAQKLGYEMANLIKFNMQTSSKLDQMLNESSVKH